ncbi:metallophosphoesterase [Kingella sp. SNUBH-2017]|jgi:hypothetical protein|uniref:Metallophosphoesterase n=1 Tax=Kingella pumchi TaxID=2779506 RepID=A0ABS9NPN0_9NEIS|nr:MULTISPECIES: metallophosphoesterase [Kingella]MCG6504071.1 metallophosphoesterase [Kingella pumchi]MDD2182361.1 metallophosphoesterase [Kingella sp. SNUBH-2017]
MKLHILSDTHGQPVIPHPEADLIVHAGDFGNGWRGALAFQAACAAADKPCVFVLGNHDFYGENLDDLPRELIADGAPLLTENRSLEFSGYTFVGGTLWSNFRQHCATKKQFRENIALARNSIADFFYIAARTPPRERHIEPEDYIARFNAQLSFIEQFRHRARTIVLTHFPPHTACIAPPYADSPLNPYFINQIDLEGFDYWIAGHTHHAVDIVQDSCRIIINPLGYPNEYGANGYRNGFLLELPD